MVSNGLAENLEDIEEELIESKFDNKNMDNGGGNFNDNKNVASDNPRRRRECLSKKKKIKKLRRRGKEE